MDTKKQMELSKETIEVFSNFIKINTQLWIKSGTTQSVVMQNNQGVLTAQIKERFSPNQVIDWGGDDKGFGIYKGDKFVNVLRSCKKPVLDFTHIKTKNIITILDKQNLNKKISIEVVSPDEVERQEKPLVEPAKGYDLETKFSWEEITQMKKMGEVIELIKLGKDNAHYHNVEANRNITTEYKLNEYKPKTKQFRFLFKSFSLQMPKGNYKCNFTEAGTSEWVNTTNRRYTFHLVLEQGSWFNKPKTPTAIMALNPIKQVKEISAKEYKTINQYTNAIKSSLRKSVEAIIEVGDLLSQAKDKFSANEVVWQGFVNNLPFGIRTIERLIYISKRKKVFLTKGIYESLPPSWGALYELGTIKPIEVYENVEGEVSKEKKPGFKKVIKQEPELIMELLDGARGDDLITITDIQSGKKRLESKYKGVEEIIDIEVEPQQKLYFPSFTITGKTNTPKKEITKLEEKLNRIISNSKWFDLD